MGLQNVDEAVAEVGRVRGAKIVDISPVEGHEEYVSIAFEFDKLEPAFDPTQRSDAEHSAAVARRAIAASNAIEQARAECSANHGPNVACRECYVDEVTVNENGDLVYHRH